ncbi:MAG: class I SAM-dependent methyltransferase [Bacteroidia bacterium]|nr:class I SAM-dependent methyltransferase [Bacteroidia bacterium]
MQFKRISSIIRYLSWADPFYKWKISRGECPLCGKSYFISLKNNPFLTRCLTCKANITNLALIPVIKAHVNNDYSKHVYELSSYGSTLDFLKRHFKNLVFSEYFPGKKFGETVNGILNEDVQHLTFNNNSFDMVTSNQVFEHVPDDRKGYAECYRVLRKGGAYIFAVPLYDIEKTVQIASVINDEVVFSGEPEYHDSRLGGAKSAPVFYRHSLNDICDRVKLAGFINVTLKEIMLVPSQGTPQMVVYAVKE